MERLLDGCKFQSITLATLQRARQHRMIEVSCSGGDGEMELEVKETRGDEDTALQGAETWLCTTPPGLSLLLGRRGETGKETRIREERGER